MSCRSIVDLTAHEVLRGLESGAFTSEQLVVEYLANIDATNNYLRAVLQVSPTVLQDAKERDRQRRDHAVLGLLHGLPVLIKAAFGTEPYFDMDTTSGNLALVGSRPRENAAAVQRLLDAGAVIIGKTSMSELAGWKIFKIPAGWSPVGGQGQSPYIQGGRQATDPVFSIKGPGGSSSGSSIGVAAGYAPIALGEETSGSLVFPADRAALYTIKPTVGTVSQSGIVPVSHRFDVAGPLAKSSLDVALFLDILMDRARIPGPPKRYTSYAKGASTWETLRIGVLNPESWLYSEEETGVGSISKQQIIREVSAAYKQVEAKVTLLKPVIMEGFESADIFNATVGPLIGKLIENDYRPDFESYLEGVDNCKISSLKDLLTPDDKFGALRTPLGEYGREGLERYINSTPDEEAARAVEAEMREASRARGIDGVLEREGVDVILGPGSGPLYAVAAAAGYPIATLPLSYLDENGCPFGLVALVSAHQEDILVGVQSAWEETFPPRRAPPMLHQH